MGGDHGHGHGPPYIVPDYKIYKVEDIPELRSVKNRLAMKGLSDPWLRNEVWRYDRKHFPTTPQNIRMFVSRGMASGFVLFLITMGVTTAMYSSNKEDHH